MLVSQHYGSGDQEEIRRTLTTMNTFTLLISVPITLLGILTIDPLLRLLNTGADIFSDARLYMSIYYIGLLPQFGYNVNANVLQGIGDSRTPLYILIASSVLHIVLAVLLVSVFPFGVAGVAWSTVLAQAFSYGLSVYLIRHNYPEIGTAFRKLKMNKDSFVKSLRVGLPIGLQNALFSLGMMVMQPLINSFGAAYIAGYNAAVKVDGFVFIPITSFAVAVTTFTGQNIGARQQERVMQGARKSLWFSLVMTIALCAVVVPLRTPLMRMFTSDQAVIDAGNAYLVRVIPLYFISTLQYVYIAVLRGAGQTLIPTIATMISLWLARVPAAYLFTRWLGPYDMHWCYAAGWVLGLMIIIPYYYRGKWKRGLTQEIVPGEVSV